MAGLPEAPGAREVTGDFLVVSICWFSVLATLTFSGALVGGTEGFGHARETTIVDYSGKMVDEAGRPVSGIYQLIQTVLPDRRSRFQRSDVVAVGMAPTRSGSVPRNCFPAARISRS